MILLSFPFWRRSNESFGTLLALFLLLESCPHLDSPVPLSRNHMESVGPVRSNSKQSAVLTSMLMPAPSL